MSGRDDAPEEMDEPPGPMRGSSQGASAQADWLGTLPVPACLIDPAAGRILQANPAACHLLGYEPGALDGTPLSDLDWPLKVDGGSPVSAPVEAETLLEERQNHGIHRLATADGGSMPVEVVTGPSGLEEAPILAILSDLTAWHERFDTLLSSEHCYEKLTELSPEAILVHDGDKVLYCNPAAADLVGAPSAQSLEGRKIQEFVAPKDQALVEERTRRILEGEEVHLQEIEAKRLDGSTLHVQVIGARVEHEGRPAIQTCVRDVTGQRRAEEALRAYTDELKRSNRRLARFTEAASHDLKAPIRTSHGLLSLIRKRYGDELPDDAMADLEEAQRSISRLDTMLDGLTRVVHAGGVPDRSPTDLASCLEEAVANVQAEVEASGATVEHGKLPEVLVDRDQLVRVFQNLVGNAIKFTEPDHVPEVHVGAEIEDGTWTVRVQDNGIGMDQASTERAFALFSRLHPGLDTPGTGAGLALTQEIIDAHGGDIWVEHTSPEGTTIAFTLPE